MTKVKQTKIPLSQFSWKLIRVQDGLIRESKDIKWLGWNGDGTFKEQFEKIDVGRSLIMSPFNEHFTWRTTLVTEIVEQRGDYIKFKTQNSDYELFKL